MKKITLIFTLAIMAVTSFAAEFKHPGWLCKDNTLLNTQYLIAKEAGLIEQQINCLALIKFNEGEIKSFTEFTTVVTTIVNEVCAKEKKSIIDERIIFHVKQLANCRNQFLIEAWNYCKANPSIYDIHYIFRDGDNKVCSDEERYAFLVNFLITAEIPISAAYTDLIKRCVEKVIDLGVIVNVTSQKADLQKINRRLSRNLLKNKTGWEPIIATVRTALETY